MEELGEMNMEDLQRLYQRVFSGEAGVTVLSDILSMLGYFSNEPSHIIPEKIAVANTIISRMNVFSSAGVHDFVKVIVQQAQPPAVIKEEDE